MHRLYENDDIVVFWNSEKCFHAKRCVHGSPGCFDPKRKPWIDLKQAETKEIWQAISECPSGALSCLYRHEIDVKMDADNCRSVAFDGDKEIGECNYRVNEEGWNIYHTGVQDDYKGKGIAKRLVYKILEEAERNCVEISATCSYAKKVIES
ncbi:GNAT family N-acetyltransferase [Butyrivibrio sp. AC2005]|uniref:GNAT family N-acetyltransferase n=1 Tax=Butyrivibrio sp. AC2005 TaxID=1280672 RepID=UPI0004181548|nr:GNAT family N-acetyltransferase [Butyrivibrio sp. AC2005]